MDPTVTSALGDRAGEVAAGPVTEPAKSPIDPAPSGDGAAERRREGGSVTTATRAYVSRLAGLPFFHPSGDRVGKVRDVVVALREGTAAPRVLGLVVEVVARR